MLGAMLRVNWRMTAWCRDITCVSALVLDSSNRFIDGCFKLDLPKKRGPVCQSHPRQWVDRSSTAYQSGPDPLSNPTQAAGRSSKHSRPVASEHSPPTSCDAPQAQRFVLAPFNKQDLNDPPTAVGGIRSNPFAFVVGWA